MLNRFVLVVALSLITWMAYPPQFPYMYQPGTPVLTQNFIHPEAACNWDGVGGQVFDRNGQPVTGVIVRIYGLYAGAPLYANVLTGISQKLGPGGYEYRIGEMPLTSSGQLTMQVYSLMGEALSYPITVSTGGTCETNLALVNFREVTNLYDVILPLVHR